jgi:hypothetical protein
MNELGQEVAAAWGLAPKPRGEGVWAWLRYHLKVGANRTNFGTCPVKGCPNELLTPFSTRCQRHQAEWRAAENAELLRLHRAYMADLARRDDLD